MSSSGEVALNEGGMEISPPWGNIPVEAYILVSIKLGAKVIINLISFTSKIGIRALQRHLRINFDISCVFTLEPDIMIL
jgi:hypothetical protein